MTKPKTDKTIDIMALTDNDVDIKAHGAVGDGAADDGPALEAAIQAAVDSGKRLVLTPGNYMINNLRVTIPASVTTVFQQGAQISMDRSGRVTFEGVFFAGNYQIFRGGMVEVEGTMTGNPFWFGAKGDGASDDTPAFLATWKVFNQIDLPYTEQGYVITSIETFQNMVLNGVGARKPIIKASSSSLKLFNVKTGGHFTIRNIDFQMAAAPEWSAAVYFDTSVSYIEQVYIQNCNFTDAFYVFTDARAKNVMMFMHFEDIVCKDSRYSTFDIEDFEGFIFLKRFTVDNSQSYTKHNLTEGFPIIDIDDVRGTIFEEVSLIGGNTDDEKEIGFKIPGSVAMMASLWWDRVTVTNCGGYGIVFGNTFICSVIDTKIVNCGGGIEASGSRQLQLDRVTVNGRAQSARQNDGIRLLNSTQCQMIDVVSTGNTGHGLFVDSSKSNSFLNCTLKDNALTGYTSAFGERNVLMNSTCSGNKGKQVVVAENGSRVANVVVADGGAGQSFNNAGNLG